MFPTGLPCFALKGLCEKYFTGQTERENQEKDLWGRSTRFRKRESPGLQSRLRLVHLSQSWVNFPCSRFFDKDSSAINSG